MEVNLLEIAERIRALRDILEMSQEDLARQTGFSVEDIAALEAGERDFTYSFLYKAAAALGVDLTELLTGETPKLTGYSLTRAGKGLPIDRRRNLHYQHLAANFRDKNAQVLLVRAPYTEAEQSEPIELSRHAGQEFDYVIEGSLKYQIGEHIEILGPGDCIYIDSSNGHGMIATGGADCIFLAVLTKDKADKE